MSRLNLKPRTLLVCTNDTSTIFANIKGEETNGDWKYILILSLLSVHCRQTKRRMYVLRALAFANCLGNRSFFFFAVETELFCYDYGYLRAFSKVSVYLSVLTVGLSSIHNALYGQ